MGGAALLVGALLVGLYAGASQRVISVCLPATAKFATLRFSTALRLGDPIDAPVWVKPVPYAALSAKPNVRRKG